MRGYAFVKRLVTVVAVLLLLASTAVTPIWGNKPILIVSGSMEPAIKTNALTILHMCGVDDVAVGDIVTYWHDGLGAYVTHRVVEKGDGYIWTKGDANSVRDDIQVTDENIYGKNFLVLNWTADLFEGVVHSEEYSRGEAVGAVLLAGLLIGIVVTAVSLIGTYALGVYRALSRYAYTDADISELQQSVDRLRCACTESTNFSFWRRVRLWITYSTCKRQLYNIEDEVRKLYK